LARRPFLKLALLVQEGGHIGFLLRSRRIADGSISPDNQLFPMKGLGQLTQGRPFVRY